MSDAFQLFPKHDHATAWELSRYSNKTVCPGKDTADNACTCPDLVYAVKVRIKTGSTITSRVYCGCCDLPVADPSV